MSPFTITILGSGSATPTFERNPSSQVVFMKDKTFLIDCAEGTQMQLRKYAIRHNRIDHIFISHLHGDHFLGLMGLLFTNHLYSRSKELHIYAPAELKEIIDIQLKASKSTLIYPLIFHPLTPNVKEVILDGTNFEISSFPLKHSVDTWGFLFKEISTGRKLRKDFLMTEQLLISDIKKIKDGEDYTNETGAVYKNEDITNPADKPRSYAYCSDTIYDEDILNYIDNTDLLYHEATFTNAFAEVARAKMHSTSIEAATIAKMANVKQLLIGHFSARYDDDVELLAEARSVFPNTISAADGKVVYL